MTVALWAPRTTSADVTTLGTVLTVWAHPDDEAFLAGGLLRLATSAGQRTACVTATLGELGTQDPQHWPPDRLAEVRAAELLACLEVLGVTEHRLLGFVDGTLAGLDPELGVAAVARVIEQVQPDTVVTFGPDGFTGHHDHRAVSRWTTAAFAAAAPAGARLLHVARTPQWWTTGPGSWVDVLMDPDDPTLTAGVASHDVALDLRLDEATLDTKTAALLAHRSQIGGMLAVLGAQGLRHWAAEEQYVDATPGL